jgi:hypothetical protein
MNSIKILMNLNKEASQGNYQKIKNIVEKNKFSQMEIDEAFRECIHNYNKNQKDSYLNCIKFFLTKTQQINFRNIKYNNTTILMYSIDESQDTPTDLIISCSKEDLDMNLADNNGENTLFHLVNNDNFSTKTKIEFIKDFVLNDYNLYSKNKNGKTITKILQDKGNLEILEEIHNKIKEYKFDQNKLTLFYNNKQYNQLFELIEKYEKNDKQNINSNSIKYNKYFVELKMIINSLNLNNKNYFDNLNNQPFQIILENKAISDFLCKIMDVLKQVIFDEGGGNPNNDNQNKFFLCLTINKMIMYYQLDYYNDFISFINQIEQSDEKIFYNNNIFYNLYKYFINIDMMIQRGLYSNARQELINFNKKLKENHLLNSDIANYSKKGYILPNDITFEIKNIPNLLNLYRIYISSLLLDKNNDYNSLIKELKNIKFEEKDKDNDKENNWLINSNNNLKSYQKYLYLKLNYLNSVSKNPNGKISYKLTDNSFALNIDGNNAENELNKIYYYHYQGIIFLKNGYYNISTYFFLKCLQIISKKTSIQLIKRNHFYPAILFNLALSYFYSKKYKNTIKYLYFLINYSNNKNKFFVNYKYIYYRLGLSQLELLLHENENINLLYISYINKKFILKIPQKSSFNDKIDIVDNFKKTFILIKNNPNDPIYFSTLINLVFCLIIKENYTEAIFYLKMNKSKDISNKNIINNYLIQCYIYLNKISLAEKVAKELVFHDKYAAGNNQEIQFYERLNSRLVTIKGFKLSYLVNLIKLCFLNKNYKDLQKYLLAILDSIKFNISLDEEGKIDTNEEMPTYIINVFVYYYLLIDRKDLALDILKKRKIKEIIISTGRK